MTLPTSRGIARATCIIASLALVSTAPTFAQDCWEPDAFEPNDVVPTDVTPGLYAGLHMSGLGLTQDRDVDRFRVDVPPLQRLILDFDVPTLPDGTSVNQNRVLGTIEPEDGSEPARSYSTSSGGSARPVVYDNHTTQTVAVLFTVERDLNQLIGCTEYAMQVTLTPRPCDVLPDDPLEGPDDCANAAVLPVGVHSGLVVFNDRRSAGRNPDVFRIPNVAPGDWFEVVISGDADDGSTPELEVFVGNDCSGLQIGDGSFEYVTNTSQSATDYTLRVTTDHRAGFEEYTLELRGLRCSGLAPDSFEPNDACGPYSALTAGIHTATLTSGDSDGFLITIPPGHRMRAWAVGSSVGQRLDVGGAAAPSCPPAGEFDKHQKYNDGSSPLDYHLRVDSRDDTCAEYTLEVRLDPSFCSPAQIAENEPNDDCASATPVALVNGHAGVEFTLTPGDVDYFHVQVPAGSDLFLSPSIQLPIPIGYRVIATAGNDCSGRSWSLEHPATPEFVLPNCEARLPGRGDTPQDYVLRVEPTSPLTDCMVIHLGIRVEPLAAAEPNTRCATASPAGDWSTVLGAVGPDRSLFAAASVEPGQTLTATFFETAARVNAPLELRFHDGVADCETRGASLGSIRYEPLDVVDYDSPDWALLRHQYTNTGSSTRRVFVELAEDPAHCQWFSRVSISLDLSPGPPYDTFCVGNDVTFDTVVCPCDNASPAGRAEGCANSTGRGARLSATGTTSIAADDWTLQAEGLPAGAPILVAGVRTSAWMTSAYPRTFMDGRLCLGIDVQPMQSGTADATGTWTASTALPGLLATPLPGERVYLQGWYRDASGPCGVGSNLTNGVRVDWTD